MKKANAVEKIKKRRVQFAFHSTAAREVTLVGDFNQWDPKKHVMKKGENGSWEKTAMLSLGTYEYKFLVDGFWAEDPANPERRPNCFGTLNNVLKVS
jgi:1,4-alpha-glucan branching enzyme